eukprot:scaffold7358_cov252-Pinguiococcus_pyrenoidosus.AAC.24
MKGRYQLLLGAWCLEFGVWCLRGLCFGGPLTLIYAAVWIHHIGEHLQVARLHDPGLRGADAEVALERTVAIAHGIEQRPQRPDVHLLVDFRAGLNVPELRRPIRHGALLCRLFLNGHRQPSSLRRALCDA